MTGQYWPVVRLYNYVKHLQHYAVSVHVPSDLNNISHWLPPESYSKGCFIAVSCTEVLFGLWFIKSHWLQQSLKLHLSIKLHACWNNVLFHSHINLNTTFSTSSSLGTKQQTIFLQHCFIKNCFLSQFHSFHTKHILCSGKLVYIQIALAWKGFCKEFEGMQSIV